MRKPPKAFIRKLSIGVHRLRDAVLDGALYEHALAIKEQQLGTNHPDTANSWFNLADLYRQTQRPAEALDAIQRATAIYTQTLGTDHPTTQNALGWFKTIRSANTTSRKNLAGWQYTALVVFVLIFAVLLLVGLQIAFNTNWLPITLLIWLFRVLTRRLRP